MLGMALGIFSGQFVLWHYFNIEAYETLSWWSLCPLLLGLMMSLMGLYASKSLLNARPVELFSD